MSIDSKSVLVVDDDADMRELLRVLLNAEGFRVMTACDGGDALRQLDGTCPSLIVLDLMMPVLDGASFRFEQRRRPELRDIPVVCLSARHDVSQIAEALECAGCFQKPIDFTAFIETVRRCCAL